MYRDKQSSFQERWKQHILPNSSHMKIRSLLNCDRAWALQTTKMGLRYYPICKITGVTIC